MKLTKSQKELMDLIQDDPQEGLSTAIVRCERRSGLSTVCREAERRCSRAHDTTDPRIVTVFAGGGWEAIVSTCQRAGVLKLGYAYADSLSRALRLLTVFGLWLRSRSRASLLVNRFRELSRLPRTVATPFEAAWPSSTVMTDAR